MDDDDDDNNNNNNHNNDEDKQSEKIIVTNDEDDDEDDDDDDYSNTIAIIGAGVAGCVLANRLLCLAPPEVKILLVERGGQSDRDNRDVYDIMKWPRGLPHNGKVQDTSPQSGLRGRYLPVVTGNGVGGGSLINACFFLAGLREDYDFLGKEGEAERALREIVERHQPKETRYDAPPDSPVARMVAALEGSLGLKETNKDSLWFDEDGQYKLLTSAESVNDKNEDEDDYDWLPRRTVEMSFLDEETRKNPRLTLLKDATVTELLMSADDSKTVTGFTYDTVTTTTSLFGMYTSSKTESISLRGFREVVLCAGAIQTPHLLMRSGIGPREELEKCSIPVVCENEAVGRNLWDHACCNLLVYLSKDAAEPPAVTKNTSSPINTAGFALKTLDDSHQGKKVMYICEGLVLADTLPTDWLLPRFASSSTWLRPVMLSAVGLLRGFLISPRDPRAAFLTSALMTVSSRGSVTLDAKTKGKDVVIDVGYLKEDDDREALGQAVRDAMTMLRDRDMIVMTPGFDMTLPDLDKAFSDTVAPYFHFAGTCAHGTALNEDFTVKGVKNLRVVDASVFPNVMHANTQAPVMIVAFLAAEIITSGL